ncbi:MAG: hypothetical protein KatS3mg023_2276 [Armatimonadota bacterium]|nr:MAG: hypothetical protein KatS3mg023_2276 [Armatimonadota bacterium]
MSEQGRDTLKEQFRHPPNRYRTLQIIHNFDSFGSDEATLRQRLEWLRATGIGGLVCNVSFKDYMRSEEQWRIFLTGLKVAEELGLHLWLYDEEGYPSGAAGGLVLERNPDLEAVGLVRKVGTDGKPRYEVQRMYEGTHCTENVYKKRRYVNLLNPLATRIFIEVTHEAYARRVPHLGKRVHAIFTDEPSLMTTYIRPPADALPALPWVEDLPEQFKRRKGYDLMPHLESLYTDTGNYRGIRCDFYEVVAQLVAERYLGQIQQWCRRHGIASSGHLLAEEKLLWHVMYYGDLFTCLRRMDIAGIDILSSDPLALAAGNGFLVPKLISSAAHLMGRTETMSETSDFAEQMGGRRATLQQMKATASLQYLLGINTITSYYPDLYGATHPNNTEQRRADYAEYNAHVGRLSLLLREAQHECDVAVLYPIAGVQANFYPTTLSMYQPHPSRRLNEIDDGFVNLCRWLLQHQIDFDIVDEAAVQKAQMGRKQFRVAKERYQALVIPSTDAIHIATLQQVLKMAQNGVTVVLVGEPPRYAASRNESDERLHQLVQSLRRDARLFPSVHEEMATALRQAGCGVPIEPTSPEIWVARYRLDGRPLYCLLNLSQQAKKCTLRLPDAVRDASLWLPETGEVRNAGAGKVVAELPALGCVLVW